MNSIEGALRTLARTPNVAAARQVLSADSAALAGAPLATLLRARRGARSLPDAPPVDAALRAALRTRLAPETLVLRAVRLARRRDAALEATLRTAARVNPVTSLTAARRRFDARDRLPLGLFHATDSARDAPLVLVECSLSGSTPVRRLPLVAPDAPLSASQSHLTLYGIATREPAALAGLGLGRELVRAICALLAPPEVSLHSQVQIDLTDEERDILSGVQVAATLSPVKGKRPFDRFRATSSQEEMSARLRRYITAQPALCPVANFHYANGARLEHVSFNPTEDVTVNYRYEPSELDSNAFNYEQNGLIAQSQEMEMELVNDRRLFDFEEPKESKETKQAKEIKESSR